MNKGCLATVWSEKMKKIVSLFLLLIMVVSVLSVFTVVAEAAQGEWNVYSIKREYKEEYEADRRSIAGYEYTDEGLHMIPADWSTSTPYATFQTRDKVNLRDGVYMKVRLDNYTYGGDGWLGFGVNQFQIDEFPENEDEVGDPNVMALIRLNANTKNVNFLQVNCSETESKAVNGNKAINEFDDQGRVILTYQITWDEDSGYMITANGLDIPTEIASKFTEMFDSEENNGMGYVQFALFSGNKGGTVECTVLKFGTCEEDAETPVGGDRQDPVNYINEIADMADASDIPLGEPAIRLNGNRDTSDLLTRIKLSGSSLTVMDDNAARIKCITPKISAEFKVDYGVSYNIKDFPYVLVIVRNLCNCTYNDLDYDGELDKVCAHTESIRAFVLAGDIIAADENYTVGAQILYDTLYKDEDGNVYNAFIVDCAALITGGLDGRINGIRIDISEIKTTDADRNNFDIYEIAYFRGDNEAQEYFENMMTELGADDHGSESGDETDSSDSASDNGSDDTDISTDNTDNGDVDTDAQTEAPDNGNDETEAATNTPSDKGEDEKRTDASEKKSGCSGMIEISAMSMIALMCAGFVTFRRKEDK